MPRVRLAVLCAVLTRACALVHGGAHRSARTARARVVRMGPFDFIRNAQKELDNFVDDAMNRRLGGGSTFYGERVSNFSPDKKEFKDIANRAAQAREDARGLDAVLGARRKRASGGSLSGAQLRKLIVDQWGVPFPVLIKRKRDALAKQQLYLVIQWKVLGKANLNLSEEEYVLESDAVASLLTEWGVANEVRREITESTAVPKTMTQQFPGLFILLDVEDRIVQTW